VTWLSTGRDQIDQVGRFVRGWHSGHEGGEEVGTQSDGLFERHNPKLVPQDHELCLAIIGRTTPTGGDQDVDQDSKAGVPPGRCGRYTRSDKGTQQRRLSGGAQELAGTRSRSRSDSRMNAGMSAG